MTTNGVTGLAINVICPHCKKHTACFFWVNKIISKARCDHCTEFLFYEIKNRTPHTANEFRVYKTNPYEQESTESALNKFELIDLNFINAMEECFKKGIKGDRKANDWKDIKLTNENIKIYFAKMNRHAAYAYVKELFTDALPHLAAIACDANILWHMFNRDQQK